MPGLSTDQLITAAVVMIVVLVGLKVGTPEIAHAAEKVTSIIGIQTGPLSINSFTATPVGNDKGDMTFRLSIGGNPSTSELDIYQSYACAICSFIKAR